MGNHESCVQWGDDFCRHAHACSAETTTPPMTTNPDELVERLRSMARTSSDVQRQMMEAKSLRQESNHERRTDLYYWPKPEETPEWKAADHIISLQARIAQLEEALVRGALDGCTCGEVCGEDPHCALHGRGSPWGVWEKGGWAAVRAARESQS